MSVTVVIEPGHFILLFLCIIDVVMFLPQRKRHQKRRELTRTERRRRNSSGSDSDDGSDDESAKRSKRKGATIHNTVVALIYVQCIIYMYALSDFFPFRLSSYSSARFTSASS